MPLVDSDLLEAVLANLEVRLKAIENRTKQLEKWFQGFSWERPTEPTTETIEQTGQGWAEPKEGE